MIIGLPDKDAGITFENDLLPLNGIPNVEELIPIECNPLFNKDDAGFEF